jgi:hypothetical protein
MAVRLLATGVVAGCYHQNRTYRTSNKYLERCASRSRSGQEGVKKLINVRIQLLLRISLSYTVQA